MRNLNWDIEDHLEFLKTRKLIGLPIFTISPVSKTYKPNELILVQIISFGKIRDCLIQLKSGTEELEEKKVQLSEEGIGLVELQPFPTGDYSLTVIWLEEFYSESNEFDVKEYQRSLLQTEILKYGIDSDSATEVGVYHFPKIPYTGKILVNYNEIFQIESNVYDGKWSFQKKNTSSSLWLTLADEEGNISSLILDGYDEYLYSSFLNYNNLNSFGRKNFQLMKYDQKDLILDSKNDFDMNIKKLFNNSANTYQGKFLNQYIYSREKEVRDIEHKETLSEKDYENVFDFDSVIIEEGKNLILKVRMKNRIIKGIKIKVVNILDYKDVQSYTYQNLLSKDLEIPLEDGISSVHIGILDESGHYKYFDYLKSIFFKNYSPLEIQVQVSEKIKPFEKLKLNFLAKNNCELMLIIKNNLTETNYPIQVINKLFFGVLESFEKFIENKFEKENYLLNDIAINFIKSISKILLFPLKKVYQFLFRKHILSDKQQRMMVSENGSLLSNLNGLLQNYFNQELIQDYDTRKNPSTVHHFEIIPLKANQKKEISISGFTDYGVYEIICFTKSGQRVGQELKTILCDSDDKLIVTKPQFFSKNENANSTEIQIYSEQENLVLKIDSETKSKKLNITEKKIILPEKELGISKYSLISKNHIIDSIELKSKSIFETEILRSKIHLLNKNESLQNGNFFVYESIQHLIENMTLEILNYPFGCLEQTLAKISTLATVYTAIQNRKLKKSEIFNSSNIIHKINQQVVHLKNNYPNEEFFGFLCSNDEFGYPFLKIQCLNHLKAIYKNKYFKDFNILHQRIEKNIEVLKKKNIKSNSLIEYDLNFLEDKIDNPESASYLVLELIRKQAALKYIEETKISAKSGVYWKGNSLAGKLQTTAIVCRAIREENPELYQKGLIYLLQEFQGERFYSTSDTNEMIQLFIESDLNPEGKSEAVLKKDSSKIYNSIHCTEGNVLVREDKIEKINFENQKTNIPFEVIGFKKSINHRATVNFQILLKTEIQTCFHAKVRTTGKLSFADRNMNVCEKDFIFEGKNFEFDLQATRKGISEMVILIYDLYNSENFGYSGILQQEIV